MRGDSKVREVEQGPGATRWLTGTRSEKPATRTPTCGPVPIRLIDYAGSGGQPEWKPLSHGPPTDLRQKVLDQHSSNFQKGSHVEHIGFNVRIYRQSSPTHR